MKLTPKQRRERDKYNQEVARRVIDKMLNDEESGKLEGIVKEVVDRTRSEDYSTYCRREGLVIACQEALESIVEWRKSGLIIGSETIEQQLRNAIAESEGL